MRIEGVPCRKLNGNISATIESSTKKVVQVTDNGTVISWSMPMSMTNDPKLRAVLVKRLPEDLSATLTFAACRNFGVQDDTNYWDQP